MKTGLTILCIFCLTPVAAADDPALLAYHRGDFSEAYEIASFGVESADSLAFQARTLLADGIHTGEQPDTALLKEAESLAIKVLKLDPEHLEGRIQLAISLSLQARMMSLKEINDSGYGELSKQLAEEVLQRDPDNAWAHGFLAVWHVEARRMGGVLVASMIGASLDDAKEHFEAAMRSASDNTVLRWQYARALMAFNPGRYRDEVYEILESIRVSTPDDALEFAVRDRAYGFQVMMAEQNLKPVKQKAQSTL